MQQQLKEIIECAIDGGYNPYNERKTKEEILDFCICGYDAPSKEEIFMDKTFWECIGKEKGWKRYFAVSSYGIIEPERGIHKDLENKDRYMFMFDGDDKYDFSVEKAINETEYNSRYFHELNLTSTLEEAVSWLHSQITK